MQALHVEVTVARRTSCPLYVVIVTARATVVASSSLLFTTAVMTCWSLDMRLEVEVVLVPVMARELAAARVSGGGWRYTLGLGLGQIWVEEKIDGSDTMLDRVCHWKWMLVLIGMEYII
jgi:hypothetical protein